MHCSLTTLLAVSGTLASAANIPVYPRMPSTAITPHESYSSSVGVVGCKINTNRIAYWSSSVGCDDFCVRVSYQGRSLNLLKIDTSGGAFDISYDAWNYLGFGMSATEDPRMGGGINMDYETVAPSECVDLLDGGRVPLLAANSMNYLDNCLRNAPGSYVANNYKLLNILDPVCHWGIDEECSLDLAVSNQPKCPSGLGSNAPLDLPLWNIQYGTGQLIRG